MSRKGKCAFSYCIECKLNYQRKEQRAAMCIRRILSTSGIFLVMCTILAFSLTGKAQAGAMKHDSYVCPPSSHCYGVNRWTTSTRYYGSYTDISMVPLACNSQSACNPNGFVDDEMWLGAGNCYCWVEVGYSTYSTDVDYFWAHQLPEGAYTEHVMGSVPTSEYGVTDHFMIIQDGRTPTTPYLVWAYDTGYHVLYSGQTPGTTMAAQTIDIGQELFGTDGNSAPPANFTRNIWAVQLLGPEYVFWYNAQQAEGSVRNDSPPRASWIIDPSGGTPEGGEFRTQCC